MFRYRQVLARVRQGDSDRVVARWHAQGIQGTTIHAALARDHGYTGNLSAVYRFVSRLLAESPPEVPMRLSFKPGEAA